VTGSTTDTGCDTLSADESYPDCMTLVGGVASYTISEFETDESTMDTNVTFNNLDYWMFSSPASGKSYLETGGDGESATKVVGSLSESGSDSVSSVYESDSGSTDTDQDWGYSIEGGGGSIVGGGSYTLSDSTEYEGYNIDYSGGGDQASFSSNKDSFDSITSSVNYSGASLYADYDEEYISDPFQGSDDFEAFSTASDIEVSTGTESGSYSYSYSYLMQVGESDVNSGSAKVPVGWYYDYWYWYEKDPDSWSHEYEVIQSSPLVEISTGTSSGGNHVTVSGDQPLTVTTGYWNGFDVLSAYDSAPTEINEVAWMGPAAGWLDGVGYEIPKIGLEVEPDTDGLALEYYYEDAVGNDGVSRSAPPDPSETLIALAAAGRNPTDITIPTVGSEGAGSGGDEGADALVASGSTTTTASASSTATANSVQASPDGTKGSGGNSAPGSHETASQSWGDWFASKVNYAAQKVDQATGVAGTLVLTGQVVSMDAASGSALLNAAGTGAGDGASVVLDTASFGYVAHERSQRVQAEAVERGDVISQIGFGAGKVGARAGQAALVLAVAPAAAGLLPAAVTSSTVVCTATTTASAVSAPFMATIAYYNLKESSYNFANGDIIGGIDTAGKGLLNALFAASSFKSALEGAGGCFAAGTPLLTPGGSKLIEELRPGDLVLAAPDSDAEREPEPRIVERTFENYLPLINLRINGQVVRTTAEHAFWARGRGWIDAHQLLVGDQLRSHDGGWVILEDVTPGESAPVYNVRIADYHTYFVGSHYWGFSVLAHNLGTCPIGEAEEVASATEAIQEGEVTTFEDFVDRSVVGDNLEGHEIWQHASLKANGLATERLSTAASQNNPVIALSREVHQQVNTAQRSLDAATQAPIDNINANAEILRDLKAATEEAIGELQRLATEHARKLGF
jgi:hypothetical protein